MKKLVSLLVSVTLFVSLGSIIVSAEAVETTTSESIQEDIDRYESTYFIGGSGWALITGDNNWYSETVNVTNCSNFSIDVNAFKSDGTQVGTTVTLAATGNATTSFYFPFDSGTYYFHVRSTNGGGGWITIYIRTA